MQLGRAKVIPQLNGGILYSLHICHHDGKAHHNKHKHIDNRRGTVLHTPCLVFTEIITMTKCQHCILENPAKRVLAQEAAVQIGITEQQASQMPYR